MPRESFRQAESPNKTQYNAEPSICICLEQRIHIRLHPSKIQLPRRKEERWSNKLSEQVMLVRTIGGAEWENMRDETERKRNEEFLRK